MPRFIKAAALCVASVLYATPAFAHPAGVALQTPPAAASTAALSGSWEGRIDLGRSLRRMILRATSDSVTIDLPESNEPGLAVTQLSIDGARVRFELAMRPEKATFAGTLRDGALAGEFRQGDIVGSFFLVRMLAPDLPLYRSLAGSYEIAPGRVVDIGPFSASGNRLTFVDAYTRRTSVLYATSDSEFAAGPTSALAYPQQVSATFVRASNGDVTGLRWRDSSGRTHDARRIAPYREHEIVFRNGDVTMYATLTLPSGPGPHPVVIMVPGSGSGPPRPAGFFPYFMVRHGVGMLSIDKRGTGASNGDWRTSTYEDLANDLNAAVQVLARRPDVDARHIGLWGNSEGGWTAPLAASLSKDVAFVIIRGASALPVTQAVAMEAEGRLRDGTDLSNAEVDSAVTFKQSVERIALTQAPWAEVWPRIAAAYDSMRDRRWLQYVSGPPQDHWWWQWWRLRGGYNPAPALEKLQIPVLVLIGDKDCCMPPSASNAAAFREAFTRGGNTRAEVHVLPNASHALMEAQTGYMSEGARLSSYAPGYLDRIAEWVRLQAGLHR